MSDTKIWQSPEPKKKFFYGYIIVLIAFLLMAINAGQRATFGIFLKPMLTDLDLTRGVTSGAFSLSQLLAGILGILTGRFLDKLGPRSIVTMCGLLMGTGYLLMSQVTAAWQLYLFYGVMIGIGTTVSIPAISIINRWFRTRRNIMGGIAGAGGAVGGLLMPLLADRLISTYEWHLSFAVLGIIVLIVVVISAQFLRTAPDNLSQTPSIKNATNERTHQLQSNDITLRKAMLTRQFWLCATIFFTIGFCVYSIMVHIAPYATDQGISTTDAAGIVSLTGGMGIIGRVAMGSIGDRFGESRAILIGFIGMTTAMVWLMFARELWMLYPFAIVFGFSWSAGTAGAPLLADIFGVSSHGAIYGACNFGYCIGVATGPFLAGYIFDLTKSYEIAFLVVTVIAVMGIMTTVYLQSIQNKRISIIAK